MAVHPDFRRFEKNWGIHTQAHDYMTSEIKQDYTLAMDAQPTLATQPNGGIPALMTTLIDPEVICILQAPNAGAEILGEKKYGDWTTKSMTFPVIENTGYVSSYGDYNMAGRSDINTSWPSRQSYHFQTFLEVGDLEADMAQLAKFNLVAEKQTSAANALMKFEDAAYHYGIAGLVNYGFQNDPSLSAALTPATKAWGGVKWINNGAIVATANEILADIQMIIIRIATQSAGRIKIDDDMTLVMSPPQSMALTATNTFGLNVADLLKKNFPKLKTRSDPRYTTAAGEMLQVFASKFDGKDTGYCAFTEKMRDHQIVRADSSFRQKKTSGTWGAILRYPVAIAQMIGA